MKPALRNKWIAALQSGDYKQERCSLYWEGTDAYCCLGVLRHVANPKDVRSAFGDGLILSDEQLNDFGLELKDNNHLVSLNDGDKARGIEVRSFKQIAVWIGENL